MRKTWLSIMALVLIISITLVGCSSRSGDNSTSDNATNTDKAATDTAKDNTEPAKTNTSGEK